MVGPEPETELEPEQNHLVSLLRFSNICFIYCFTSTFHFSFPFHSCFIPVSCASLLTYIFSFTLSSEAAHLTPSLFLPLCTINTRDVVDSKLTYSWEYIPTSLLALKLNQLVTTVLKLIDSNSIVDCGNC